MFSIVDSKKKVPKKTECIYLEESRENFLFVFSLHLKNEPKLIQH